MAGHVAAHDAAARADAVDTVELHADAGGAAVLPPRARRAAGGGLPLEEEERTTESQRTQRRHRRGKKRRASLTPSCLLCAVSVSSVTLWFALPLRQLKVLLPHRVEEV